MLTVSCSQLPARASVARSSNSRPLLPARPVLAAPGLRTNIITRVGSDPGVPTAGSRYTPNPSPATGGGSGGAGYGGSSGGSGGSGGNFGGMCTYAAILP